MFIQSIWGLAQALEARDPYTKSHSENVMRYAVGIAETLGTGQADVHLIRRAAMMHDIGKIGVPDAVLRKPGDLNQGDREVMERHPLIAIRILDQMRFLEREMPIVRHHHERWDGGGYPDGIAGPAIPTGARILAVADAFDAITSNRIYRNARGLPDAVNVLTEESGKQFDPEAADAMRRWIRRVERELKLVGKLTSQQLLATQKTCVLAA
jgi:putative nucleotidyltransferase with HDIG domain